MNNTLYKKNMLPSPTFYFIKRLPLVIAIVCCLSKNHLTPETSFYITLSNRLKISNNIKDISKGDYMPIVGNGEQKVIKFVSAFRWHVICILVTNKRGSK